MHIDNFVICFLVGNKGGEKQKKRDVVKGSCRRSSGAINSSTRPTSGREKYTFVSLVTISYTCSFLTFFILKNNDINVSLSCLSISIYSG